MNYRFPEIVDDVTVRLIDSMGDDASICQAARVSVSGQNDAEENQGLINYLLSNKHGSPFEHNSIKLFIEAPIFVFREFMRHRIGFSYNEMSGRYTELPGKFYIPRETRPLFNTGSSARPQFTLGEQVEASNLVHEVMMRSYTEAWGAYQVLLKAGIAKEVSRMVLPVGIFSQMYVTCNARSMMNFLSLRTSNAEAAHVSHPQWEIERVAKEMERIFADIFPMTYAAYNANGRVAP